MIKKVNSTIIGSGLIGDSLAKKLRSLKHKVTVLHHDDEIKINDADYIFYVASYGNHYSQTDEYKTFKANVFDYLHLLRDTIDVPYTTLFYFSTSSVTLPVQTNYSDSKYIGEIISKRFSKRYKKPIVVVRPSSVYGIGEKPWRFFPVAINNVMDGKDMPISKGFHDWIEVTDFVNAVTILMKNTPKVIGKSVPIGTGIQTSNHQVMGLVMKLIGKTIKLIESDTVKRKYDTVNWVADNSLIKSMGWKQKVTLEKGLSKMFKHYVSKRTKAQGR